MNRNRYRKILWTVTIACILIGTVGRALGFFRHEVYVEEAPAYYEEDFSEQNYDYGEPAYGETFHTVRISGFVGDVQIMAGDHYHYSYEEGPESDDQDAGEIGFSLADGCLTVEQTGGTPGDMPMGRLMITVPGGVMLEEIDADVRLGSLQADGLVAGRCRLNMQAGDVSITGSDMGSTEVVLSAGELNVSGTLFTEMTADVKAGNVSIYVPDMDQCALDLSASLGNVSVDGENYGNSLRLDRQDNMRSLKVVCGAGNINVYRE